MDEKKAVAQLKQGSEEALRWLIDRYTAYVSTIVLRVLGQNMPTADTEEVTADVFVSLWRSAEEIQSGTVRSWLGSVARNTAKNRLRQMKQQLPLEEEILVLDGTTPDTALEKQEQQRAVRRAVLAMEQPTRDIFLRHYFYCQSVADIAREMHMNASTVKSHLRRGREKLRLALQDTLCNEGGTEVCK